MRRVESNSEKSNVPHKAIEVGHLLTCTKASAYEMDFTQGEEVNIRSKKYRVVILVRAILDLTSRIEEDIHDSESSVYCYGEDIEGEQLDAKTGLRIWKKVEDVCGRSLTARQDVQLEQY